MWAGASRRCSILTAAGYIPVRSPGDGRGAVRSNPWERVMKHILRVILLVLVPVPALAQGTVATDIEAVADSIAAEVLKTPVAGIAVAVAHGGEVIFRKAYGMADVAARMPLTPEDQHQVGSVTKQFTAAAILQLVEQGRISLDDTIQKFLPDFDTQGRTVTIHHLLNHTSGIRSYTAIFGMNPVSREALLDTIQRHPYDFVPGEKFLYNNSGYYLLGVILERVTGTPYAHYLEERFFDPLGLRSTSYCGRDGEEIPVGYAPDDGSLTTSLLSDMEFPGAAGGLCSTVDDLLAWQHALVSGEIVKPETYVRMTTPAKVASGEPMTYGYGLAVGDVEGHPIVAHDGGIPGFNSSLAYFPADSLGVAVLVNTAPGYAGRVQQAIARAALGLPPEKRD